MQRAVSSLPLCSSWLAKLASCGFESVDELKDVGVVELSKEIGVSHSEALEILKAVKGIQSQPSNQPSSTHHPTLPPSLHPTHLHTKQSSLKSHSALELLHHEQMQGSIVTFCASIDEMMGGGVALGKVTEFCGAPGLGKTQMSIQLAVDASIPEPLAGVGGEAVYIDTEGSFIVERVAEVASAAVRHLKSMADDNTDQAMKQAASGLSLEAVLSSIHLYRCHDYLELMATINILPDFIHDHPKVRLVVIDSIASHFRHGFKDMSHRNRLLGIISQNLIQIATSHNIAVVLTNQMTTKVTRGERRSAQLVPALGESWGHASTVRVVLFWSGSERKATLYKSPTHKEATVTFAITADGVRDTSSGDQFSPNLSVVDLSSQCVPLPDEYEDDDRFSETDDIMAGIEDPSVWQGGEEGGTGGDGESGAIRSTETSTDFVSVSHLHNVPRGRKRPHPSDPEL